MIRHHPGTVGTIPGSSLINCTWNDLMPYDLTAVPGTGSMQFEIMTHLHIFKDGQSPKKPSSAKRFYAQMLPTLPVMTNQPLKPCDGPRAGDGKYCDYSSPDAHTLNVKVSGRRCEAAAGEPAFTHSRPAAAATHQSWCLHRCAVCRAGTKRRSSLRWVLHPADLARGAHAVGARNYQPCGQLASSLCATSIHGTSQHPHLRYLQVEFAPYFLIPVGGIWRTLMSASRMVEPPPPKYPYPGYPVSKTVITLDKASGVWRSAEQPCMSFSHVD